jgi:hypothetical protein
MLTVFLVCFLTRAHIIESLYTNFVSSCITSLRRIGSNSSSYILHLEDGGRRFFQNISIYVQDHNLNSHCPANLRTYNTVTDLT